MKAKPVFKSMHVSSQSLSIPCLSNGQVRFFLLISPKSYDHDRKNIQIHTKVQAAGEFVLDCPPCGSGMDAAVLEGSGWDFKSRVLVKGGLLVYFWGGFWRGGRVNYPNIEGCVKTSTHIALKVPGSLFMSIKVLY